MTKILKVVGASWLQTKISSYILGLLGILAILALFVGHIERSQEDGNYAATVFYSEKTGYRIEYWGQSNKLEDIARGVARAYFRRDVDTAGWSLLEVETDGSYRDEIQAYAAGIVEGALTWSLIHNHLENTIRAKCDNTPLEKQCDKLKDALDKSINIWKSHADDRGSDDPFWHHVSLHYTQIDGISTGWKHGVERSLNEYDTDISDLYWLNSVAEVAELQHKLNITLEDPVLGHLPGLSSAFLRIVNATSDDGTPTKKLFVAHNAAGSYSSMTRILKRYKLNYHLTSQDSAPAPGIQVDFSGYPGSVTSQDEFYVLRGNQHRMAVTGTTLKNYNDKLWKEVNITEEVPLGPRVTAANHLATNVSSWGHVLATNNSGTGCKQWLLVDYDRFDRLHDIDALERSGNKEVVTEISVNNDVKHTVRHGPGHASGLLWLVEQVPGLTHARDLSATLLEQGYFATYGLPFIQDIANITHTTKMQELYGDIFSESESPRAVLFKDGVVNSTTLEGVIKLMRHLNATAFGNDTTCTDEVDCVIKDGGYWSVLGVRGDIVNKHREPYGVIDTKVISGTVNQTSLDFVAVAGPPFTEVQALNTTDTPMNKGNVATIYTDQFNDKVTINGFEIQDLVEQQMEEAEQETLALLNKDTVKPFQWSASDFDTEAHEALPDRWAFELYRPKWSW
uniref:Phospholipase B-like n=1 Tax=Pectinophora gossypiella TaxID=13191 RepID=A0A1E1WM03_PECGO